MVWPRQKDARGQNTKINYGLDTTGEKGKSTSKKNVDGRSTSRYDNKKCRTRTMEKQRRMAFGFRKKTTAVKNRTDRQIDINLIFPKLCEKSSMRSAIANNVVSSLYLQNVPIRCSFVYKEDTSVKQLPISASRTRNIHYNPEEATVKLLSSQSLIWNVNRSCTSPQSIKLFQ